MTGLFRRFLRRRNNSRKIEGKEPKQKQHPVVDVTGDRSKVWCCKEQYCLGTWNVRSMNQGKLEVVKQESEHFPLFPLFLCIDRWGRLSYLSLLFFRTLHSNGHIFPFLLCFRFLFFSQLFVRPPQTAILLFLHFFFLGIVLLTVSYTVSWTSVHSSSGTLSIRSSPLSLFLTSTV